MAEQHFEVPGELRVLIARDLRPISPLSAPARRSLGLIPFAVALLFGAVVIFGLRRDAGRIGLLLTWGASTLQMLLGLALVVGALREAVPGTTLPRRVLGIAFGSAVIAVLTITFMTWTTSPTMIAPGLVTYVWGICLTGTVVSALPVLAVAGWLAARAFPLRPRLAGALYGVGAGLMADSGWRLFCHFSHPAHVLGAHTLGIVVTGVLGMITATLMVRADDSSSGGNGVNGFTTKERSRTETNGGLVAPRFARLGGRPDHETRARGHLRRVRVS